MAILCNCFEEKNWWSTREIGGALVSGKRKSPRLCLEMYIMYVLHRSRQSRIILNPSDWSSWKKYAIYTVAMQCFIGSKIWPLVSAAKVEDHSDLFVLLLAVGVVVTVLFFLLLWSSSSVVVVVVVVLVLVVVVVVVVVLVLALALLVLVLLVVVVFLFFFFFFLFFFFFCFFFFLLFVVFFLFLCSSSSFSFLFVLLVMYVLLLPFVHFSYSSLSSLERAIPGQSSQLSGVFFSANAQAVLLEFLSGQHLSVDFAIDGMNLVPQNRAKLRV